MKIGSGALMLSNLVPDEDRIGGLGFLLPDLADNLDMWLALFAPFLSVAYPARCPACTVTVIVPRSLVHFRVCVRRTTTGMDRAHPTTGNEGRMSRN